MKGFYYGVSKTVEKVRDLAATLESNTISSINHTNNSLDVFKDSTCCEDFQFHLKRLEMCKIKGNDVDLELALTELETKGTNLINQN